MKFSKTTLILLAGTLFFTFNSCKKETADTETTSATDNNLCESEFNSVLPETNKKAVGESGVKRGPFIPNSQTNGCPSYYLIGTPSTFPITMRIMYDSLGSGCVGSDGKTRKGWLDVYITAPWDTSSGQLCTITLQNYYVNGIHYQGTIGIAKVNKTTFTQTITNGECSKSSWDIKWNCTRTMKWDSLSGVFTMWGSANGTNRDGKNFTVDVSMGNCITKTPSCAWISKGLVTLTPEGMASRTIDFGYPNNGACDNKASLTINGKSFEFTLP